MDRRKLLGGYAGVAVGAALVGWIVGQQIKSPAEVAAEAEPPPASLITVPVEERVLSQMVVVRGTVEASDTSELTVSSAEGSTIVTGLPKEPGDEVVEGDVLIDVAGRPVIALEGELPVYRNLIPTNEGPDVEQLEQALDRLGFDPGTVDGEYDLDTADAVEEFYRDAGYSPPEPDDTDVQALSAAEDAVTTQEQLVSEAEAALEQARAEIPESQRLQLEQGVTSAENQLSAAESTAEQAKADAADAVADAEDALAELQSQGAPQDEIDAATEALEDAEAARAATETEQDNLVAEAEANLELQEALREEGLTTDGTAPAQERLDDAEDALDGAEADLADARAKVGAQVPAAELVFFEELPQEVQAVNVEVGDSPTGPALVVSGSGTIVNAGVSANDRQLIEVGAEALMEDEALGISIPATVAFVADNPGGPNLSAERYRVRLEPTQEVPDDALNQNLRISIPISSTGGEVLAVPFAALSAASDQTARVEVQRTGGQTELVQVTVGLRAEGFVEVEPVDGSLTPGDRVVVGRDLELPGAANAPDSDSDDADDGGGGIETETEDEVEDEGGDDGGDGGDG